MSKFEKPKISYTPSDIDSAKFGIPPYFKYYCEYHKIPFPSEEAYNEHMAKAHPELAKDEFGDFKPFEEVSIRDQYPPDEREAIDEILEEYDEAMDLLEEVQRQLEDKIKEIKIPYDPKKDAMISAAHKCPNCGNPHASNVITGDDIINRIKTELEDNKTYASSAFGDVEKSTPEEILRHRNNELKTQINNMTVQVLRQIISWVLGWLYSLLKPLEIVPIVKAIPKGLKKAIERMRSKGHVDIDKMNIFQDGDFDSSVMDDFDVSGDVDPKGFSTKEAYKQVMKLICPNHHKVMDEYTSTALEGTNADVNVEQYRGTLAEKEALKSGAGLMDTVVANDYVKKNGEKYINNAPEAVQPSFPGAVSLDALDDDWPMSNEEKRKKPKGRLIRGLISDVKKYGRKAQNVLNGWMNSEEIMCCFIYNLGALLESAGIDFEVDGKKLKLSANDYLQTNIKMAMVFVGMLLGILEFHRNLVSADYKKSSKYLYNMVLNLITGLIQTISECYISMLNGYLREHITQWTDGFKRYKADTSKFRKNCIPFEDFANLIPDLFRDLMLRLSAIVPNFLRGLTDFTLRNLDELDRAEKLYKYNKYIDILRNILEYLKFSLECSEQDLSTESLDDVADKLKTYPGTKVSAEANIRRSPSAENILQNAKKASTINKETPAALGVSQYQISNEREDEFNEELRNSLEPDRVSPWGYTGYQVLMTNFIGIAPEKLKNILNEDKFNECHCKEGWSVEEVKAAKEIFKL